MHSEKSSVTVSVPASTSNLGPGFDTLGLALSLSNETTIRPTEKPSDAPNPFFQEAAERFFQTAGGKAFPFECEVRGEVPRSRGLGSSVTVRLGILMGLNELTDSPLTQEGIFRICADLEGHPDNAAPSCFGGFVICRGNGRFNRYEVGPEVSFILAVPELECSTNEARSAVPNSFCREDAVFNVANTAAIAAAFASGCYQDLDGAFDDRFHQPFRAKFLPFFDEVMGAGRDAGAVGGWLSGSGSTIACMALEQPGKVADAMLAALRECTGGGSVCIVQADNRGAMILEDQDAAVA